MKPIDKVALAKFLENLSQKESSGGTNFDHKMIKKGPNTGETAGGKYGIVPSSLKDFVNQAHKNNIEVPEEIKQLIKLPHEEITKQLNENRDLDESAAQVGGRLVLQRANGDEPKAAYGWNMGHNKDLANLDPMKVESNSYVKDFINKSTPARPKTFAEYRQQDESSIPPEEPSMLSRFGNYVGNNMDKQSDLVKNSTDAYKKQAMGEEASPEQSSAQQEYAKQIANSAGGTMLSVGNSVKEGLLSGEKAATEIPWAQQLKQKALERVKNIQGRTGAVEAPLSEGNGMFTQGSAPVEYNKNILNQLRDKVSDRMKYIRGEAGSAEAAIPEAAAPLEQKATEAAGEAGDSFRKFRLVRDSEGKLLMMAPE